MMPVFSKEESEWMCAAKFGDLRRLRQLSTASWTAERFREVSGRALILATEEQSINTIKWLLRHPSGVELNSGYPYMTPLMIASCTDDGTGSPLNFEIAKELLEHGANIATTNNIGTTALHFAAREGCKEIVQLLLDHGADVNIVNDIGASVLLFASYFNHPEIIQLLVDYGADVNAKKADRTTALSRSCEMGYGKCVKLLLSLGANVTGKDVNGRTPFELALDATGRYGQFEHSGGHLKMLIAYGANIDARLSGPYGHTPLTRSCYFADQSMFYEIIDCGADIRVKNMDGKTPLEVAKLFPDENGSIVDCLENLLRPLEPSILSLKPPLPRLYHRRLLLWLRILEQGLNLDCGVAWTILGYTGACCDLKCS